MEDKLISEGLMKEENLKKYDGQRILYRFTDVQAYQAAKAVIVPRYQNQSYNFQNFKCHNPIRDMKDAVQK